jgi:hypothetical protein
LVYCPLLSGVFGLGWASGREKRGSERALLSIVQRSKTRESMESDEREEAYTAETIDRFREQDRKNVLKEIKKLQVWDIPFAEGYADGVRLKDLMSLFGVSHQESKMFNSTIKQSEAIKDV